MAEKTLWQEWEAASHVVSAVQKQREMVLIPVHILLSVQPGSKVWDGMILSLFRTSQLDLSRNIVMDVPVTLAFLWWPLWS